MALTKTDKKEVQEIVIDAMTTVMMPVLDKLFNEVSTIKEDVAVLKEDVSVLKEDLSDVQLTVNRIETLQRSELGRVDNHEVRITKLEKAKI